jgi:hypothetical protein
VIFEGHTVHVRDLKGMRYLARLLADPGREFHVLDLVAAETGGAAPVDRSPDARLPRSAFGDAGAMLDARAKDAYRRRLAEIDDDIDQGAGPRGRRAGRASRRLGIHLDHAIRTGAYCAYAPDPHTPTLWGVMTGDATAGPGG